MGTMSLETAQKIVSMINKELSRNSLAELCEEYDVSVEDFQTFLTHGVAMVKMLNQTADPKPTE